MNARYFCGLYYVSIITIVTESSNVVTNTSGEQLRILRQIPDVTAEGAPVPREYIGAIEPNASAGGAPNSDQQPRQSGLPRTRRSDYSEGLASLEREGHAFEEQRLGPGQDKVDGLDRQPALRARQGHCLNRFFVRGKQALKAIVSLARGHYRIP